MYYLSACSTHRTEEAEKIKEKKRTIRIEWTKTGFSVCISLATPHLCFASSVNRYYAGMHSIVDESRDNIAAVAEDVASIAIALQIYNTDEEEWTAETEKEKKTNEIRTIARNPKLFFFCSCCCWRKNSIFHLCLSLALSISFALSRSLSIYLFCRLYFIFVRSFVHLCGV